jgi:PTH1 family peptidyl-tRNA hydrolase
VARGFLFGGAVKIICGLGNPGREYERHRHNIGFAVVEALAARWKARFDQSKFDAELATASVAGEKVLLLKPQTFMNLSGQSLGGAARFYKVGVEDVLVVHDELDLPFGRLQLKAGGGSGGHNGLKSIAESWGEEAYGRLRFGIGRPPAPGPDRVVGHVLSNFSVEEQPLLQALIDKAADAAEAFVKLGLAKAMNAFNRK